MSQDLRTAADVLLELETKVNTLLGTIQNMDLNIKILSNKLNEIMKLLEQPPLPKATVEAVKTLPVQPSPVRPEELKQRTVTISADAKLPEMGASFPRTSRPETFAGSDVYLPKTGVPAPFEARNQANKPPPGRSTTDNVTSYIPQNPGTPKQATASPPSNNVPTPNVGQHNIVPVEQRVVDSTNKGVFLANVEITDPDGNAVDVGTKLLQTKGNGKWNAPLPPGVYKVTIRKFEMLTKQTLGAVQMITIDGTQSPLKLPTVIIK